MPCKLFQGGSSDTPECSPLPWNVVSSNAARSPRAATTGSPEDLRIIEQRMREAREAGRAEGEAQSRKAALAEVDGVLQKLTGAIYETSQLRPRLRAEAEADMVRLAIAIARKIVGRELNADPDTITGLVKAALEKVRTQEILRVRVHPDHGARIRECLSRFGASQVEIVADANADRGTAVFETTRGNFDASVESQLREIERGLTDRFKGQPR
ncbi:MAG TPA: FliH/SctL family protein [Bryobacteraceae bacterium]|jgi:flagellar assembly protein FliH|nr:FliH/SctL family protein [Bryobacteraceae bacterium]